MAVNNTNSGRSVSYFNLRTVVLLVLLVLSFVSSLLFGAQKLTIGSLFQPGSNFSKIIFFNIRLPRSILVLIAGALLAGSGAVFQMFFRNPLAEPGIMGISAGATLGAVLALSLCAGVSSVAGGGGDKRTLVSQLSAINIGALCGALAAGVIVTILAFRKSSASTTMALLLCGTALGTLYAAITSILLAANDKQLHTMYNWMLGSFSGRGWNEVYFILLPAAVSTVILLFCARQLDLLAGGEEAAYSLGVNVTRLRIWVIIGGALGTSAAVCAGGTIGFVGLIAPHAVRRIFGAKARSVVPLSMVAGAFLLLCADVVCRLVVAPAEIPVGTVTALLGVPFFIVLLLSPRGLRNA